MATAARDSSASLDGGNTWVKLAGIVDQVSDLPPIVRAQLTIQFENDDDQQLFQKISNVIPKHAREG